MVMRSKRTESPAFLTPQSTIKRYCGHYTQRRSLAPAYAQIPRVGSGLHLFTLLPRREILRNSLDKSQCHAHLEGIDVCFELHCFAFSDRPHVHGWYFEFPSRSTHTASRVPNDDHVTLLVIDELVGHNHRLDGFG